jgi:hypothetical protein
VNTALIWIPVAVLAVGFVVFCEVDLARAEQVRYLPKWGWAILCTGIGHRVHDSVWRDRLPGVREGPPPAPWVTIKESLRYGLVRGLALPQPSEVSPNPAR